jgi:prefoldin subunit 5
MLLIDDFPFNCQLEEQKGVLFLAGEYGKADEDTANGRIYRTDLWRREIDKKTKAMKEGKVFGELDHPGDGVTKLQRVSHMLVELDLQQSGIVYGKSKIFDGPPGRQLRAIVEGGGRPGTSSRGQGNLESVGGKSYVSSDYAFATFDFVVDPACRTAFPKAVTEEVHLTEIDNAEFTVQILQAKYPGMMKELEEMLAGGKRSEVEEAVKALREEFEKKLATAAVSVHMGPVAVVTEMERVKVELETEKEKSAALAGVVKAQAEDMDAFEQVGRSLVMASEAQSMLSGRQDAMQIIKEAGNPLGYPGVTEYKNKIGEIEKAHGTQASGSDGKEGEGTSESVRKLTEELDNLKVQIQDLERFYETVKGERNEFAKAVKEIGDEFKEYKETAVSELKADHEVFEAKVSELEAQMEEMGDHIKVLTEDKADLELKLGIETLIQGRRDVAEARKLLNKAKSLDEAVEMLKRLRPGEDKSGALSEEMRSRTAKTEPRGVVAPELEESGGGGKGPQMVSHDSEIFGVSMREIIVRSGGGSR